MFKHILLPTDGSPLSAVAIRKGIELAKTTQGRITGLCVLPQQRYFSYDCDLELSADLRAQIAAAFMAEVEKDLQWVKNEAKAAGVQCQTMRESSDRPYEVIVAAAEKLGCDLIVMASHGLRGLPSLLLGSETQKVLTHSKVPVLVFR